MNILPRTDTRASTVDTLADFGNEGPCSPFIMYTSSDDNDDGYYDNYISRGLCGTCTVNQQEFSILDAINIGLKPKPRGQCWICPLGYLFVPSTHPDREQVQATLF